MYAVVAAVIAAAKRCVNAADLNQDAFALGAMAP